MDGWCGTRKAIELQSNPFVARRQENGAEHRGRAPTEVASAATQRCRSEPLCRPVGPARVNAAGPLLYLAGGRAEPDRSPPDHGAVNFNGAIALIWMLAALTRPPMG